MTVRLQDVAAVVLAGGEGRRIGGRKPLRALAGRTLLDRAVTQARAISDTVAVAVRDPDQAGGSGRIEFITDAAWEGPLGGLAAALDFARDRGMAAVLTLPCDMPLTPPDLAAGLAGAIGERKAALAASGGRLHPVCGLWRVEALDRLTAYAQAGGRSLRGLAAEIGFSTVDWPVAPVDPFFNVNTAEDLARAEALLRP